MSKGNMLLGHARGKVGDLVFSRTNGQQVVRSKAAVVKNPKTEQQTIQRIILNTVAQAYSKMKPIVDHSFERVPEGQKSMSKFLHDNLAALRTKIANAIAEGLDYDGITAFTPIGQNIFSPNDFIIATGSLPAITIESFTTAGAIVRLGGSTYQDVIDAYGLKRGDQLTFVMVKAGLGGNGATNFEYARIILDPQTPDGVEAPLSSALLIDGAINLPSPRNTGEFTSIAIDGSGLCTFVLGGSQRLVYSAAVIVSRKADDGTWLRSNTQLATSLQNTLGFQNSLQQALDFSQQNSMESLSSLYLNNAGTGRLAAAGSSANFTLDAILNTEALGSVNIVRFGFEELQETGSGVKVVLCGYTSDGSKYWFANGNAESSFYKKGATEVAQTWNNWSSDNTSPYNGSTTIPFVLSNADVVEYLMSTGYMTAAYVSVMMWIPLS